MNGLFGQALCWSEVKFRSHTQTWNLKLFQGKRKEGFVHEIRAGCGIADVERWITAGPRREGYHPVREKLSKRLQVELVLGFGGG